MTDDSTLRIAHAFGQLQGEVKGLREDLARQEAARAQQEAARSRGQTRSTVALVALAVVVVALATIGVTAVLAERSDRATVEALLCAEVVETRQVLVSAFERSRAAAAAGTTGTTGEDRAAQVRRFDQLIDQLSQTRCAGVTATPAALVDDLAELGGISDQLDELEDPQRRDLAGEDEQQATTPPPPAADEPEPDDPEPAPEPAPPPGPNGPPDDRGPPDDPGRPDDEPPDTLLEQLVDDLVGPDP